MVKITKYVRMGARKLLKQGKSLREVASIFRVSHEGLRQALSRRARQTGPR